MDENYTKQNENTAERKQIDEIVEKIKTLVKKGNIAKIIIKKDGHVILNLPLNVGILGGIIGAATAPWALIVATIATVGLKCGIELIKDDGEVITIL